MKNIILIMLCGLLASCVKWGSRENKQLIRQVREIVEQMPDSALMLLDRVSPVWLKRAQTAEYFLLRAQASDGAGKDMAGETEIFRAREYFLRRKDAKKAAIACLYAGKAMSAQGKASEAVAYLLEARDLAAKTTDDQLMAQIARRIGDENYALGWYENAKSYYAQAMEHYRNAGDASAEIAATISIGNCYLLENNLDSAFASYARAESMAYAISDTAMKVAALQGAGAAFWQTGELERAKELLHVALGMASRQDSARLLNTLGNLYLEAGQHEKSFEYSRKVLEKLDENVCCPVLLNVYRQLMYIEAHRGRNGERVMEYYSKHMACLGELLDMDEKKALQYNQRKYDFDKAQARHDIRARNYVIAILSILIAVLPLLRWTLGLRKGKKRLECEHARALLQMDGLRIMNEQLQKLKDEQTSETIADDGEKSEMQQQLAAHVKNRYDSLLKIIMTQFFSIMRRLNREYVEKPKNTEIEIERLNVLLFGKKNVDLWEAVKKMMPSELLPKIERLCPKLSKTEIKICCLIYLNADNADISAVLNVKDNTVYAAKSRIRLKLGISQEEKIRNFLDEKLAAG